MSTLAPPAPRFELRRLWRQRAEGDDRARERLILLYAPVVSYVAARMASVLPAHVDREEVTSFGLVGLMKAVDAYDPARGVPFEPYAMRRIHGEVLDSIRALDWAPRSLRRRQRELRAAMARIEQRTGRPATDEELQQELGLSAGELDRLLGDLHRVGLFSLDEMFGLPDSLEHESSLGGLLADEAPGQEDLAERAALRDALAEAVGELPERERIVVALYYYDGLRLREIGEVLGVTESRCSQLLSKAVNRLRSHLDPRLLEP